MDFQKIVLIVVAGYSVYATKGFSNIEPAHKISELKDYIKEKIYSESFYSDRLEQLRKELYKATIDKKKKNI